MSLNAQQQYPLGWIADMGGCVRADLGDSDERVARDLASLGLLERGTRTAGWSIPTWELTEAGEREAAL